MAMVKALVEVEDVYYREYENTLYITVNDLRALMNTIQRLTESLSMRSLQKSLRVLTTLLNLTIHQRTSKINKKKRGQKQMFSLFFI